MLSGFVFRVELFLPAFAEEVAVVLDFDRGVAVFVLQQLADSDKLIALIDEFGNEPLGRLGGGAVNRMHEDDAAVEVADLVEFLYNGVRVAAGPVEGIDIPVDRRQTEDLRDFIAAVAVGRPHDRRRLSGGIDDCIDALLCLVLNGFRAQFVQVGMAVGMCSYFAAQLQFALQQLGAAVAFLVDALAEFEEGADSKMVYKLLTNSDGTCVAKTSLGMFEDLEIDNDLAEIIKVIDAYNEGE